jgi:divalent metal cation (Fe/Co/Zn/Cd) transporter
MSSISHPPAGTAQEHDWFSLFLVRETWASLAIGAMWIAVSISAVWGPDFVLTTGAGTNSTTIPSGIAVAMFATIGTWAIARYAFRSGRDAR